MVGGKNCPGSVPAAYARWDIIPDNPLFVEAVFDGDDSCCRSLHHRRERDLSAAGGIHAEEECEEQRRLRPLLHRVSAAITSVPRSLTPSIYSKFLLYGLPFVALPLCESARFAFLRHD